MNQTRWSCLVATGLVVVGLMLSGRVGTAAELKTVAGISTAQSDPMADTIQHNTPLIIGRVSAIDTWDQTVTVTGFLVDKTFQVVSGTEIDVGVNTVATLDDLKIGDHVQVRYHKNGKALVADRITDTSENNTRHGSSTGGGSGAY